MPFSTVFLYSFILLIAPVLGTFKTAGVLTPDDVRLNGSGNGGGIILVDHSRGGYCAMADVVKGTDPPANVEAVTETVPRIHGALFESQPQINGASSQRMGNTETNTNYRSGTFNRVLGNQYNYNEPDQVPLLDSHHIVILLVLGFSLIWRLIDELALI